MEILKRARDCLLYKKKKETNCSLFIVNTRTL